MSIDFDSAALQTQHDEEEYDQEDYAREQELHKLLTDLPDDMLEDSRDSSPELECSTCSNKNTGNGSHPVWTQKSEWTDQPRPPSPEEDYEVGSSQGSDHNGYVYEDGPVGINPHGGPTHSHGWNQQTQHGGYTYTDTSTERSAESYETEPYPRVVNPVEYDRNKQTYVDQNDTQKTFENFDYGGSEDRTVECYKATYNPHKPACQPKMFNSHAPQQEGHFDHLQREFLDSAQDSATGQQLAQLQILYKAQQRKTEDLEQKLEDSRRNMRYLEHQFAIVKDEKDGLAVSLRESSRLLEEAKEREAQMQNRTKSLEQQVKALTERDHENLKKQRVAEAAVDSIKQQMAELCRSDTLSRAREQHDRDITATREQHEVAVLALQQQLDACDQALKEQAEAGQTLREQAKQLERQREEEQVERAAVMNSLTQRLEESQRQCAKLLQTGSVQELSQLQIKLQQAQAAKALSENMNQTLQEDLADLKGQITLYESAVKHGVIALDLSEDWEYQLSDSYVDLGIKKANWKNGRVHSTVQGDPKLPKEEALRELRAELQRCLASLKGKRQRMSQLQEELQLSQAQVEQLQTQLDETRLRLQAKETSQAGHPDVTVAPQKDLLRLQEDKQLLEDKVEALETTLKEVRQKEEKVKSANSELCTKMREMIHELDQEKQEAAERYERVQRQCRDEAVNRVRTELLLEHQAQVGELNAQHQQYIAQLQTQLSEANDKMAAVQECYISVCKDKDGLEERLCGREKLEALNTQKLREESAAALEGLRAELKAQHQASVDAMQALCHKEMEAEQQRQLNSLLASARATWEGEREQMERTWAQRLEEASGARRPETAEASSETDGGEASTVTITVEELESRLSAQKRLLQLDADEAKHKAVEEARKRAHRELQGKHLEDMANQVEGAVTRAYSRWLEDFTSLPEYKASLQREKDKWEELQKGLLQQQVSQALSVAEEQWRSRHTCQLEERGAGAQREEQLQDEVASLQSQLEHLRGQQAALLKAELAAARAAWNRDKQQELSSARGLSEREQREREQALQKALQEAQEEAELQRNELLLRSEAELQNAMRAREEQWRGRLEEQEQAGRQRDRREFMAELQAGLAELQAQLLRDTQRPRESLRDGTAIPEGTVAHVLLSACREMLDKAVSQASRQWKTISEERLSNALKEKQEHHEQEIKEVQNSLTQRNEEAPCGKRCTEAVAKLQKKNQELQRHLEKACRQLQHTVRDNKATVQRLRDEYEDSLRKAKENHLLQLEEAKESSGRCDQQQSIQLGLEEMKEQYMSAVEKIRGDMLHYLQESKERAAEMIRVEVQRERQNTARKMRRYYLTCLQELLEDGGQPTGAEKKIMSAAGKLAAMAKVLETPIKTKPEKNHIPSLSTNGNAPRIKAIFSKNPSLVPLVPETRPEQQHHGDKGTGPDPLIPTAERRNLGREDGLVFQAKEEAGLKAQAATPTRPPSYKPPRQPAPTSMASFSSASRRSKSREGYLQGAESGTANGRAGSELQRKMFLIQDAPVRDEGQSNWSAGRSDANAGFQVAALSHAGKRAEPKLFSQYPASSGGLGEFGILTPDVSDLTVYNEIAKLPPYTKTSREPIPGSEGGGRYVMCASTLFSELRQSQQDSGFDSPFSQPK